MSAADGIAASLKSDAVRLRELERNLRVTALGKAIGRDVEGAARLLELASRKARELAR